MFNLDDLISMVRQNQQFGLPAPVTAAAPVVAPVAPVAAAPIPVPVPVPTVDPVAEARKGLLRTADQKFGANYGQKNITSSLLDDTINSILQEQKSGADKYLERGRARGIYNDVGYNAARAAMGSAEQAGASRLRSLGGDVINRYRADANAVRDKAYSAISGYSPDREFSLDPFEQEGNEVINRARTNAAGDLRNAFGGTQLFDFSSLNNRAGAAQGAINMRDTDVATALGERRRRNSLGRGLGSQGAF